MDHRVARWNRWSVPFLLVGPAIGRSDRLHIWGDTNPDFVFCVVAALSSPFRRNAGFTITLCDTLQLRQRRGFYGTVPYDF